MKYQPKVSTTQKYSDSQGEHIVCKGKLLLIDVRDKENLSDIAVVGKEMKEPIIISETEEIEVGDWCINNMVGEDHKDYMKIFQFKDHMYIGTNKILALPEHFSDKHLQAITDGKMKDGDEVLVKCEQYDEFGNMVDYNHISNTDYFKIHLVNSHITLFPAKQSLEEAAEEYADNDFEDIGFASKKAFKAGAKWAKKNNY